MRLRRQPNSQEVCDFFPAVSAVAATPGAPGRIPPGQYLTPDFPVLSAGPTPTPLADWSFTIRGASTSRSSGPGTSSASCRQRLSPSISTA